jgi:hypothetical protein
VSAEVPAIVLAMSARIDARVIEHLADVEAELRERVRELEWHRACHKAAVHLLHAAYLRERRLRDLARAQREEIKALRHQLLHGDRRAA